MTNEPIEPIATCALDHGSVCLLVTGAPGAGKSTVSRLLADVLSRSAYLDAFRVALGHRGVGDDGWWFDTSELTAEQTVERLVSHAFRRARLETLVP